MKFSQKGLSIWNEGKFFFEFYFNMYVQIENSSNLENKW